MNKENATIIRALNKYSKVPENWELLNQIEQLEQELDKKNKIIEELKQKLLEKMCSDKDVEHQEKNKITTKNR